MREVYFLFFYYLAVSCSATSTPSPPSASTPTSLSGRATVLLFPVPSTSRLLPRCGAGYGLDSVSAHDPEDRGQQPARSGTSLTCPGALLRPVGFLAFGRFPGEGGRLAFVWLLSLFLLSCDVDSTTSPSVPRPSPVGRSGLQMLILTPVRPVKPSHDWKWTRLESV